MLIDDNKYYICGVQGSNSSAGGPKTICTEAFIVIGADFNLNRQSCEIIARYLKTRFARYLHSLAKASHDATSRTYRYNFSTDINFDRSKSIAEIDAMIIALGYRVQSQVTTRFRRWATQCLHEYIRKGFAMDDERLKKDIDIEIPLLQN